MYLDKSTDCIRTMAITDEKGRCCVRINQVRFFQKSAVAKALMSPHPEDCLQLWP